MLSQDGLFGTGPAKQPEGLPDELRRLAQRIRTFTEGSFPPSPPPALVDKITDTLLVTALDVVTAVAAEEQQLSSNAAVRLLAWTLADARGAVVPLDKPLALTVGKRLHRQAQSVRAVLAAARDEATLARGNPNLTAAEQADIDATEQAAFDRARAEEYVGFHELLSLLPSAEPAAQATDAPTTAAAATAATTATAPAAATATATVSAATPAATTTQSEHVIDNSIPPDLVEALGRDGAQCMWDCCSEH